MTETYKFDDREISWALFAGFDNLWYHILDVNRENNSVDMLMKFAANAECVPHTHVGPTRTLVLEGEHHVCHKNGANPNDINIKRPGTFSINDGNEMHTESGGPDGAIILLMMKEVDGRVYDLLNDSGDIFRTISLDDFERGLQKQQQRRAG